MTSAPNERSEWAVKLITYLAPPIFCEIIYVVLYRAQDRSFCASCEVVLLN